MVCIASIHLQRRQPLTFSLHYALTSCVIWRLLPFERVYARHGSGCTDCCCGATNLGYELVCVAGPYFIRFPRVKVGLLGDKGSTKCRSGPGENILDSRKSLYRHNPCRNGVKV